MDKIAFIGGTSVIYWSPILLVLAAATAIGIYSALYINRGGHLFPLAVSIFLSIFFGLFFSRLIHWYLRMDAYKSLREAFIDFSVGGFALMGVFFGCFFSALVLRALKFSDNLPQMLDCMSIGGGFGIALGRLSALFNTSDRGMILPDSVGFPFSFPVFNAVSGAPENRLATFMLQFGLTLFIVISLCSYMALASGKKQSIRPGDICLLFLMSYGASQILCDSTRYDSLYFPANRFVSVVQILGLLILLVPIGIFSFRAVKLDKLRPKYILIWAVIVIFATLAGLSEYYVQRRSNEAVLAYSIMAVSLLIILASGMLLRWNVLRKERLLSPE